MNKTGYQNRRRFDSQDKRIRALSICICQCVKVVFDYKTIHEKIKVVSIDMDLKVINLLTEMNVTRKIRWIISVLNFKLTHVADFFKFWRRLCEIFNCSSRKS